MLVFVWKKWKFHVQNKCSCQLTQHNINLNNRWKFHWNMTIYKGVMTLSVFEIDTRWLFTRPRLSIARWHLRNTTGQIDVKIGPRISIWTTVWFLYTVIVRFNVRHAQNKQIHRLKRRKSARSCTTLRLHVYFLDPPSLLWVHAARNANAHRSGVLYCLQRTIAHYQC